MTMTEVLPESNKGHSTMWSNLLILRNIKTIKMTKNQTLSHGIPTHLWSHLSLKLCHMIFIRHAVNLDRGDDNQDEEPILKMIGQGS
jgi:hypothetical protein